MIHRIVEFALKQRLVILIAVLVLTGLGVMKTTDLLLARAEVSYQAGTFAILDLLDAYRAAWDARAQALALEKAFAQAEAELEHAAVLLPVGRVDSTGPMRTGRAARARAECGRAALMRVSSRQECATIG
jgi:uncharacterized membrane-anchored protein